MTNENQKNILIVTDDEAFANEANLFFKGFDEAQGYALHTISIQEAIRYSLDADPQAVIIHLDQHGDEIFTITRKIADHFQDSKILCTGNDLSVDIVLKLIKYGAQDFLKLPFESEEIRNLFYQIEKESESVSDSPDSKHAQTLTVLSPKGGTGVTFLAINLAVNLAELAPKKSIAVVDLRPQSGDVATYLNVQPVYTLRDVIDNIEQVDQNFLEGITLKHKSGIEIIASPRDDQEPLNLHCLSELREILTYLQQMYDILIIDGCYVDELLLETTLLHSDQILLLGNLDVPSLKGLVSALNKLAKYQIDLSQVAILINRYNSKNHLDASDFEKKTGHRIACNLPNDYGLCIESINRGIPINQINGSANLSQKIKGLAQLILADDPDSHESKPRKKGKGKREKHVAKGLFGWMM